MLDELARSYLEEDDPIRASGFGGGPERWRAEREPILDGVTRSGSLLDIGCANGHLLACLVEWAGERGIELTPHGVDRSERLVERARAALPEHAANLHVGDAWSWVPPQRYDYVYALHDCVPPDYLPEYVGRVIDLMVAPGGRLILGAYGSRSQELPPFDVRRFLEKRRYTVSGWCAGGKPPIVLFAWVDKAGTP
jgi:SAM-dependent methyltransferase